MQLLTTQQPMPSLLPSRDRPPRLTPPSLYTKRDAIWYGISLWPVWVSCPSYASSQLLVHFLTGRAWKAEKSL